MNRPEETTAIDGRVARLRRPTLDAAADARILAHARGAFLTSVAAERREQPRGPWARIWDGVLEPVVVAIALAGYLGWTAHALAALDWGRTLAERPALPSPSDQR